MQRYFAQIFTLMVALTATQAFAGGDGWMTDYQAALAASKKTGKPVLADFTGSDWCGWCIKLKKEVFSTDTFKKWADDNVILLELDYPRGKSQPAALKRQNAALAKKYNIRGYPTILFLDGEGEVVGRSGYREGGAEAWIKHAQSMIDAAKPKPAPLAESVADALEAAKKDGKAIMLITTAKESKAVDQQVEALRNDQDFAKLAEHKLILSYAQRSGEGAASKKDVDAVEALAKQFNQKLGAVNVMVVDPTQDKPKLLFSASGVPTAKALIRRIENQLPRTAYNGEWLEDYDKAKMIAAEHKRPLFVEFTGSDWCPPCIKLHNEVLSTDEFEKYAAENLVLVKIDFPRKKKQSEALKQQNAQLAGKYGIRGVPTVLIFDSTGAKQLGKLGYMPGGPSPYIKAVKQIISRK